MSSTTQKDGSLIYMGPSLRGKVNRFTVYRNGLPKHIEKEMGECPALARLFIAVSDMNDVLVKMEKQGTPYHTWYQQAQQYLLGGVNNGV